MQNIFECDITGTVVRSTGPAKEVRVEIREGLYVVARLEKAAGRGKFIQGDIGPDGVHVMEAALTTLRQKEKQPKKKGGEK